MFFFCPICSANAIVFDGSKKYSCLKCGWIYYHNAAAAVMAIMTIKHRILFIRRKKDPQKGKLDLPGGFVDPTENAEQALKREIKEELFIDINNYRYLGSAINKYIYKNITYHTCDLIYHIKLPQEPVEYQKEEITALVIYPQTEIDYAEIAFGSVKYAIELYKQKVLKEH